MIGVQGDLENALTFDLHEALADGSAVMCAAKDIFRSIIRSEKELYANGS